MITVYTSGGAISATDITVNLIYSGTAINAVDYDTNNTISVTIPAGLSGVSFALTGLDDLLNEGNESISIDIDTVDNATEYGTQVQNLTILDDDIAYVLMNVDMTGMNESG